MAYLVQLRVNHRRSSAHVTILLVPGPGACWQTASKRAELYALGLEAQGATVTRDFPDKEPGHGTTQPAT